MNSAAASLPAVSAAPSAAPVLRVTTSSSATVPRATRASITTGHGRWLATAAAVAIVVLTALTLVLNALEAREGVEYGTAAATGGVASVASVASAQTTAAR